MLFFQEKEANSGEEGNIEQVSIFLPMNPNNAFQKSFRLRSNEISPKPVINGVLFDETVNGATVGGEIGGISVGIYKKPKQIVGEFGGHVVDVNPKGKSNRVIWMGIESIRFGIENGVVEVVDV